MVAIKTQQIDSLLKTLPAEIGAYLVFGIDEGRISETAVAIARNWSRRYGEGGEILSLDDRTLAERPETLAVELRSVPMFGGRTVIRAAAGSKTKPDHIEELLAERVPNLLVLEAGNLPATSALRKLFEKLPNAAAIACYPDEARDITRLIDEELGAAGLAVTPEARRLLAASLGGDRGVTRMELAKLALYAHGQAEIDVEDVTAAIGDSSQLAYDSLIAHVLAGETAAALTQFERLEASGQGAAGFVILLGRHLLQLCKARAQVESGRSPLDSITGLRPPVYFRTRDTMVHQVTRMNMATLQRAAQMVQEAVRQSRLNARMETLLTERLIIALARLAARPAR